MSETVPYWQSTDGAITVYHDRWENVVAAGLVPVREVALVHADPPYGVGPAAWGNRDDQPDGSPRPKAKMGGGKVRAFAPVAGDDKPYDPSPLLSLGRPLVLWGANHYAPRVPESPSWIVWDKREEVMPPDNNSDAELAWPNLGGCLRVFRHWWRGALRKTEKEAVHLHPTQKPIALCSWVYQRAKLKPGALVFVPYGGSGPDLPACRAAGLRCIWVECDRSYCDTAIARLGAVTAERAAEPAGPLFQPRSGA